MLPSSGGNNTVEDSYKSVLQPLLMELEQKGDSFPKTIVYTKLKWCGFAYDFCNRYMREKPFMDMSMVSQYHSPCKDDVSNRIVPNARSSV